MLKKHYPIILITLIMLIVVLGLLFITLKNTNGSLIYTLDDAYIHMAMAKHFSQNGEWGVTRYNFSSSTSSPLYTFLLSVINKLDGVNVYIPFIINLLLIFFNLILVYFILNKYQLASMLKFILLMMIFPTTACPKV